MNDVFQAGDFVRCKLTGRFHTVEQVDHSMFIDLYVVIINGSKFPDSNFELISRPFTLDSLE